LNTGQLILVVFSSVVAPVLVAIVLHRLRISKDGSSYSARSGSASLTKATNQSGHGSDSSWWEKWQPTPEIVSIRAKYKDLLWAENDVPRLKEILQNFWDEEQAAWGEDTWNTPARNRFFKAVSQVTNRELAIRVIENLQAGKY